MMAELAFLCELFKSLYSVSIQYSILQLTSFSLHLG